MRGVTAEEIVLGVEVVQDFDAGAGLGAEGITTGDLRAFFTIAADDINARGGIAGRQVRLVAHEYDNSTEQGEIREQAACGTFVEDNEVFVVLTAARHSDVFRGCLTQAGVGLVSSGLPIADEHTYRSHPAYFDVGSMNLHRVAAAYVEGLVTQGFFAQPDPISTATKIGLLRYEGGEFERATAESLRPALAEYGLSVDQEVAVTLPTSSTQYGDTAAQVSSAVLQFRAAGVTHVLLLEPGGFLLLLFASNAESQQYRPRYGLSSLDGGQLIADNVPAAQMHGSILVGWVPLVDVNSGNDPGRLPQLDRCIAMMAAAGRQPADRNAEANAGIICETMWVVEAAGNAARGALQLGTFVTALEGLGSTFPPATTFASTFGPGRHDGAAAVRHAAYVDDCACFRYVTDPLPLT